MIDATRVFESDLARAAASLIEGRERIVQTRTWRGTVETRRMGPREGFMAIWRHAQVAPSDALRRLRAGDVVVTYDGAVTYALGSRALGQ